MPRRQSPHAQGPRSTRPPPRRRAAARSAHHRRNAVQLAGPGPDRLALPRRLRRHRRSGAGGRLARRGRGAAGGVPPRVGRATGDAVPAPEGRYRARAARRRRRGPAPRRAAQLAPGADRPAVRPGRVVRARPAGRRAGGAAGCNCTGIFRRAPCTPTCCGPARGLDFYQIDSCRRFLDKGWRPERLEILRRARATAPPAPARPA